MGAFRNCTVDRISVKEVRLVLPFFASPCIKSQNMYILMVAQYNGNKGSALAAGSWSEYMMTLVCI